MEKRRTLWERIRTDIKEEMSWDAKKFPHHVKAIEEALMNNYFWTELPFGIVLDINDYAKKGTIDVNVFADFFGASIWGKASVL